MKSDIICEIWRDVPGWEGVYQISNMGRMKSFKVDPSVEANASDPDAGTEVGQVSLDDV